MDARTIAFQAQRHHTVRMTTRWCLSACWVIYLLYWFISAIGVKRVAERQSRKNEFEYRLPTLIGGVLLIGQNWPSPLNAELWNRTPLIDWIGVAACFLGLLIAIWARRTLAGNWSATVTFKQDHELIECGPYRYVRHPIYTGILLMCVGTAICKDRLAGLLGVAILSVGFWIKLQQEEVLMRNHFPAEYPSYEKRVKRLIPFVL